MNENLNPREVAPKSDKKIRWICKEGHSYDTSLSKRTSSGRNCPYCANKRALKGYNDLESQFPEIASEWDYEKNSPLRPDEVLKKSNKKVY